MTPSSHLDYVNVCAIGCLCECEHRIPCEVFMIDSDHPHPKERGHEVHYGFSDDGSIEHVWHGKSGRCRQMPNPYKD